MRLRDQYLQQLHELVYIKLGRRLVLQWRGLCHPRLIFVIDRPLLQQRELELPSRALVQLRRGLLLLGRERFLHSLPVTILAAASAGAACSAAAATSIAAIRLRDQQLQQLHELVYNKLGRRVGLQRRGLCQPRLIFVVDHPLLQWWELEVSSRALVQLRRGLLLLGRGGHEYGVPFATSSAAGASSHAAITTNATSSVPRPCGLHHRRPSRSWRPWRRVRLQGRARRNIRASVDETPLARRDIRAQQVLQ